MLSCALTSSFRESGIVSPLSNPVVAVRTSGLAFDVPVGIYNPSTETVHQLVEVKAVRALINLASSRFDENFRRMNALQQSIEQLGYRLSARVESKEERAARKRQAGLEKQKQLQQQLSGQSDPNQQTSDFLYDHDIMGN